MIDSKTTRDEIDLCIHPDWQIFQGSMLLSCVDSRAAEAVRGRKDRASLDDISMQQSILL